MVPDGLGGGLGKQTEKKGIRQEVWGPGPGQLNAAAGLCSSLPGTGDLLVLQTARFLGCSKNL